MAEPSPDQQAIIDALVAGKAVAFWPSFLDKDGPPGFVMRSAHGGFQVRTGKRDSVGSFADFDAAWAAGMKASRPTL